MLYAKIFILGLENWNFHIFFQVLLKQIGGDKVSERESHLKIMMLLGGQC